MVVAVYYRADLITGELNQRLGYAPILRGDPVFMHTQAVQFAKRRGADAYQLCEGTHAFNLKPVSLTHDIRGFR